MKFIEKKGSVYWIWPLSYLKDWHVVLLLVAAFALALWLIPGA